MAREAWTDERLDDLNRRVGEGFVEMREGFRSLRGEMREEFQAVRGGLREEFQAVRGGLRDELQAVRGEVRGEIGGVRTELVDLRNELANVRDEIGALNRTFAQVAFGLVAAMLVSSCGILAAIVTQG